MMASNVSRDVSQDQSSVVQTCKPWYAFATVAAGRFVRFASRVTKHGGSALPGKVVEKIDPGFLTRTLGQLPLGVVLVSGTNGKTTTTRMVASMLSDLGLKVFTNPTGSNFVRGVVSALLTEVTLGGKLDADIAVLELDEAYAVHFVKQVKPRYALLLNVMRDQLDRFGEIDTTAKLLSHVAAATTGTVVLNREDPRIAALAAKAPAGTTVRYFGLADDLRRYFPSDDDMATTVSVEGAAGHKQFADCRIIVDNQYFIIHKNPLFSFPIFRSFPFTRCADNSGSFGSCTRNSLQFVQCVNRNEFGENVWTFCKKYYNINKEVSQYRMG